MTFKHDRCPSCDAHGTKDVLKNRESLMCPNDSCRVVTFAECPD